MSHHEGDIVQAWEANAAAWADLIAANGIESRRLATDQAVVDTVLSGAPATALDVGCGEGWLARRLSAAGARVLGVDAIPALIETARRLGGAEYDVCSYADIAAGALTARGPFDAVVCNFALLGDTSVRELLAAVPSLLTPTGRLVVQTLHPVIAAGDTPYVDGWRDGLCAGCGAAFTQPAPWYFRTLGGWVRLLHQSGLRLVDCREPLHPATGRPVSILFVCQA